MPGLFETSFVDGDGIVGISGCVTGRLHQLPQQSPVPVAGRQQIEKWRITVLGNHIQQFIERAFLDSEEIGVSHILIPDTLQVKLGGLTCQLLEGGRKTIEKLFHSIDIACLLLVVILLADTRAENFCKPELIVEVTIRSVVFSSPVITNYFVE